MYIQYDTLNNQRRDCESFQEAFNQNIIYFIDNKIHAPKMWCKFNINSSHACIKKLMEKAIHELCKQYTIPIQLGLELEKRLEGKMCEAKF